MWDKKRLAGTAAILGIMTTIAQGVVQSSVDMAQAAPAPAVAICSPNGIFTQIKTKMQHSDLSVRQQAAKRWLSQMMKPLGANTIGGGTITADQAYGYTHTGTMTGRFTVEAAGYPVITTTNLSLDNEAQAAEGYRGAVTGKAKLPQPGTYEVRAYLYTDSEYAQPDATVGTVRPDGSWELSTTAVDPDFKGVWHFRLYDTATGLEVGESWPRPAKYQDLELRYYLETDSRYLQSTQSASASNTFAFTANNNVGHKIFQLVNTKTGAILAEDYRPPVSGLIRSYEYLPGMDGYGTSRQQNTYTYDQALALLVAVAANDRTMADELLRGLSQIQVQNGEFAGAFPSSSEQNNPTNVDKTYYTGGNAFVLYALTRYVEAYGDVNNATSMLRNGLSYIDKVRTVSGDAAGLYQGGRGYRDDGSPRQITWHSTEHNTDLWHVLERASRVLKDTTLKQKADSLAKAIVEKLWNDQTGRFRQGFQDEAQALDTASWGSVFLSAVGEHEKAVRSAANTKAYAHTSARATGFTPYVGRADSVPTVWYEGTYGVALAHAALGDQAELQDVITKSMVGQRPGGGFPYADDADVPNGRSTATSVASTAWFLLATAYPEGIWSECRYAAVDNIAAFGSNAKAPNTGYGRSYGVYSIWLYGLFCMGLAAAVVWRRHWLYVRW